MRKKDNALTGSFAKLRAVSECFESPPAELRRRKFDPFSNIRAPKDFSTVPIFISSRIIGLGGSAGGWGAAGGVQGRGRLSESLRVILCKGKSASDTVFGNNVDHDFTCAQASDRAGIIQFSTYVI